MDTSLFGKLAPEIRNCIYELVLDQAEPFELEYSVRRATFVTKKQRSVSGEPQCTHRDVPLG